MKEFIQALLKRTPVFIIIIGVILLLIGAASEVTIGTFSLKIPDIGGRILVVSISLALIAFGIYLEFRERTQPKDQPLPQNQTKLLKEHIDESKLASILQDLRDKSLPRYINTIVVDKSITLQKCPDMEKGWKPAEIEIYHKNVQFRLSNDLIERYNEYFEKSYKKKYGEDGLTVMMVERPIAWTDQPRLRITTQLNRYSYSQFYWNVELLDQDHWSQMMNDLFEHGKISFPHNLNMQLVVMTDDEWVLITRRSKNVGIYSNTWSCSIEENWKPEDLKGDRKTSVVRWMNRAILEELGVSSDHCKELRVLSVFLEGTNRLNISMVGHVILDLNRKALSERIASIPRSDYEFTEHDYFTLKQMANELRKPERDYHPSSRYRMLMTLLHRYGEPNFAREYIGLAKPD